MYLILIKLSLFQLTFLSTFPFFVSAQHSSNHAIAASENSVTFVDVSAFVGISHQKGNRIKYGGASVADLDGDGWPDLLLGHHDNYYVEVYFNQRNGTFENQPFQIWRDTHALTPVRLTPNQHGMHFVLSRGGGNGLTPNPPQLFRVDPKTRAITEVTADSGLLNDRHSHGRGRSILFGHFKLPNSTDGEESSARIVFKSPGMLLLNAEPTEGKNISVEERKQMGILPHERAFEIQPPNHFIPVKFSDAGEWFGRTGGTYGIVTDILTKGTAVATTDSSADISNAARSLQILTWQRLRMWNRTGDFEFNDISLKVFPPTVRNWAYGVVSVAELDYDNDGRWDLFVTCSATGETKWQPRKHIRDFLLRNIGGRYIDVTNAAGIETNGKISQSRGATVGDFDNDGHVDIIVSRYDHYNGSEHYADTLYRNNGDGTFERLDAGLGRKYNVAGDMPTAVDYDRDGRLDLVVSEGDWFNKSASGMYRVFRNTGWYSHQRYDGRIMTKSGNNWLLVRIRNAPMRRCTSLHAVVRVWLRERSYGTVRTIQLMRRVGSPGTTVSNSYVELLHFGLGKFNDVTKASVTWADGTTRFRMLSGVNKTVTLGV